MAFLPLKSSKLSNLKISSISKQFSVTKIQIFSFREEKCLSVWSYDKNISTFWQKRTFTNNLCLLFRMNDEKNHALNLNNHFFSNGFYFWIFCVQSFNNRIFVTKFMSKSCMRHVIIRLCFISMGLHLILLENLMSAGANTLESCGGFLTSIIWQEFLAFLEKI